MTQATKLSALVSLLLTGAIFGFFYAYVCSAMWGLDQVPPAVAIEAMQAINAAVRNAAFMPAFFLTPLALAITAGLALAARQSRPALWFAAAAALYLIGGLILTMAYNVPMNETLATVDPNSPDAAAIWADYSPRWQMFNLIRTVASGIALLAAGLGLLSLANQGT